MLDMLTLDQLRVFVAVADSGSFSGAARSLGRVQSAVSQQIRTLETTLGVTLFDRTTRLPRPTEAGSSLLRDARRLIDVAGEFRARAASMREGTEAELTLAIDTIFPNTILMATLEAFAATFPRVPVTLFTEGLGASEQRLRDGLVALAIYSLQITGAADLEAEPLVDIEMIPVVASHHPLASLDGPISRDELETHVQLVLTDRSPLTAHMLGGVVASRFWRFADLATRLDYLLAGFGWCNMPVHLVAEEIAAGRLTRIHPAGMDGFDVKIQVVHHRARPPGPAGRWFLDELRRRLAASPDAARNGFLSRRGLVDRGAST